MPKKNIDCILISPETSIRGAMDTIEKAPKLCGISGLAVVVDSEGRMAGIVTDGDIRSAILHGADLAAPVHGIMTKDPVAVANQASTMQMYEAAMAKLQGGTRMLDKAAGKILVTDENGRVVDVVSLITLLQQADIKTKKIAVIGLGFVGLTLAVVLADVGFQVAGVELREDVRQSLRDGTPHFYEAGLAHQLRYHVGKRLHIVEDLSEMICDVYVISVGTPVDADHKPIMTFVHTATLGIAKVLKPGDVVMLRSTVPVGTTRKEVIPLLERETGTVAGKAIKELRTLPQVIGATDQEGEDIAAAIFREMTHSVVRVDSLEAAELVKLINNSFRDLIFSFSNEIALLCEKWNLDAFDVIEAANEGYPRDPVPTPSPGVGGVCLYKDPHLLAASAAAIGMQPRLFGLSRAINEYMPLKIFQKYHEFCQAAGLTLEETRVFVIGLAFKGWPETSDMRNSTAVDLVNFFKEAGLKVFGYDHVTPDEELRAFAGVEPCSLAEGFANADAVFVMNNHPSYDDWDLYVYLKTMNTPGLFFDGWNMFHPEEITRMEGISYSTVSQNLGWPEGK
jgi:UDP-N-acetyl-D-mannosaminuronic acid dehydrogenase